ncbi:MAG: GAF domain-containing protein, partial [Armatimonadetes bacterium]|nr:GAF domain-containing protein [Armatimonadota bacterium]
FAAAAATEGLRAAVVVPLALRGRVLGLMRLFVDDLDALTDEQYLSLDVLAALGAFTIEKVRLHDSLVRLAESLNASLELGPMLQQVLQTTVDEMGFTAAAIRLLDREGQLLKLAAAVGLSEEYLAKGEVELARSAVDQRALAGEIVVRRAGEEAGWQYPEELARENIQMVLVVPLILRGVPKGVLRAYSARPRQFGPVAQQYLRSVAGMVALAVEKAELHAALQSRYEDLKLDLAEWYQFLALG